MRRLKTNFRFSRTLSLYLLLYIVMGNKCCRPEINQEPKYLLLLKSAYNETSGHTGEQIFVNITEQLNKKGYIKTLCDHLSSHQHRINPALQYCKTKLTPNRINKQYQAAVHVTTVSSVVCSKIIKLGLEIQQKIAQQNRSSENIKKSKNRKNWTETKSFNYVIGQFQQNIFEICCETMKILIALSKNQPKALQENSNSILKIVLKNLENISRKKRQSVQISNKIVRSTLSLLMSFIESGNDIKSSMSPLLRKSQKMQESVEPRYISWSVLSENKQLALETYRNVVRKQDKVLVTNNSYKDIVKEHLPKIIQYWANNFLQRAKLHKKQSIKSKKGFEEEEEENMKKKSNLTAIQEIILLYFNSYFSDNEPEYIYKEIMIIFDRLNFSRHRISPIERLFFEALNQYDLRDQVIYRWFDYLLDYLAQTSEQLSFLETIMYPYNYSNLKNSYKNILHVQNIVGCIETINEWIHKKVINVKNINIYKGSKTITAILLNLSFKNGKVMIAIQQILEKLIIEDQRFYVTFIETVYNMISKIKISQNYNELPGDKIIKNKRTQNDINLKSLPDNLQSQTFILSLINIGTNKKFIELIPDKQKLVIIKEVFMKIFKKIKITDYSFQCVQEYLIKFISTYYGMIGDLTFNGYDNLDMNVIAEIFEPLIKYFADFIHLCRNQFIANTKDEDGLIESLRFKNITTAIISLSAEKQKVTPVTQTQSNHILIKISCLFRETIYLQMIKNLIRWTNCTEYQKKSIDNSKLNKNSSAKEIKISVNKLSQHTTLDSSGNQDIQRGMAMCSYTIHCLLVRHLINQVSISPSNKAIVLNLLLIIQICFYSNQSARQHENSINYTKKIKMKKKNVSMDRMKAKIYKDFVEELEKYIEETVLDNQIQSQSIQTEKKRKQNGKEKQSMMTTNQIQEISMKLLQNKQKIVDICDSIGPQIWKDDIKKIVGEEQTFGKLPFCSFFKNNKAKVNIVQKNHQINDLGDTGLFENQYKVLEALNSRYEEFLDSKGHEKNNSRELSGIKSIEDLEMQKQDNSAKTEHYEISKSSQTEINSFNDIINVIRH